MGFKSVIKKLLYNIGLHGNTPPVNAVRWGSLKRTKPISFNFGYNRGGPVDRYYIEKFLEKNAALIKGNTLEIADNNYTLQFGGSKVSKSDILYIDNTNSAATIIADLTNAPQIADNSFDCIILTQTLQFIYNYKEALITCYRILKPGGVLLLTVPGISHIDYDEWGKSWFYSFTELSVKKTLQETFAAEKIRTEVFGNVMIAAAFLYGVAAPEISKKDLDDCDPHYQVIIAASAIK